MFTVLCKKAYAETGCHRPLLTAGMANAETIKFNFSADWDTLTKTAVFTDGKVTVDVLQSRWLTGNTVNIPAEVLATAGRSVRVGVYGTNASGVVLPTVWATLGKVQPAAEPSGDPSADPTLPVWAQLQEIIGDIDDLTTTDKNNLVAAINEAAKTGSGGAGSIALRTADGYIQYSNDGGATWENLIAIAELKGAKGDTGPAGANGTDGITPSIGENGNWYLGTTDTGKPSRGEKGDPGATGAEGPAGKTPVKGTDYFTEADKQEIASAAAGLVDLSGKQNKIMASGILKGDGTGGVTEAEAGVDYATPSLGITGAAVGQAPTVKTIDEQGKPTEWEPATLAKVDGSNIPSNSMDTFRTNIGALPGVKVYGKADANGKIMAYTDAACTEEVNYLVAVQLTEYGNALLIYDHKTYQCVGFEKPASMQGSGYYLVAVFFRSEIVTGSAGAAVLKVETAKLNVQDYMVGMINAPITITAGELQLTTTTTT